MLCRNFFEMKPYIYPTISVAATVADCSQLINGPPHIAGGVLDLVLTNVPDLCS